ncbi:hypothetical protein WNY39_01170 [Sulfitobacter sp. AS59]
MKRSAEILRMALPPTSGRNCPTRFHAPFYTPVFNSILNLIRQINARCQKQEADEAPQIRASIGLSHHQIVTGGDP